MLLETVRADQVRQEGCLRVMKKVTQNFDVTLRSATLLIRALHHNVEKSGIEFFPQMISEHDVIASSGNTGMLVREGLVKDTKMGLMLTNKASEMLVAAAEVQKEFQ